MLSTMKNIFTYIPTRFIFCGMVFLGHLSLYLLRNTIAVAIVEMNDKGVIPREIWGLPSQDVIQCSFYPLYIVCNFMAGSLAVSMGGKRVFGLGIGASAALSCLTPSIVRFGHYPFIAVRVLQGIFQGLSIASIYTMFGKWFPKSERTRLQGVCRTGFSFALLIGQPITGYLCASEFLGGWPSVFYVFGVIAWIWCIFWCIIVYESPSEHPWISTNELSFILEDQGDEYARKNLKVPWRQILRSPAVWCMAIAGPITGTFNEFFTMDYPSYLRNVFQYDIKQIGWLSSAPQFVVIPAIVFASFLADYIIKRNPTKRRTLIRKCFNIAAYVPAIVAILVATQLNYNPVAIVSLFTFAIGIQNLNSAGSLVTTIDLGPVFAGTIFGIVNGCQCFSCFFTPLVDGAITAGKQSSKEAWNTVFYLGVGSYVITTLLFLVFGSADLQPWGLGEEQPSLSSDPPGGNRRTWELNNCSSFDLNSQVPPIPICAKTNKESEPGVSWTYGL